VRDERLTAFVELKSKSRIGRSFGLRTISPSRLGRNIDNTSHTHGAMRSAEIIIKASAHKSDAVLSTTVGENALAAVHVIRGTEPPVCHAINSAGDTVAVADPIPANGLALCGVDCARDEGEALPYGDIQHRRR
jgi:hypothetical protein